MARLTKKARRTRRLLRAHARRQVRCADCGSFYRVGLDCKACTKRGVKRWAGGPTPRPISVTVTTHPLVGLTKPLRQIVDHSHDESHALQAAQLVFDIVRYQEAKGGPV